MAKIDPPSIFRRKRFAKVMGNEFIMTMEQQKVYEAKMALNELFDEIENNGCEISEEELDERLTEFCTAFGIEKPNRNIRKQKQHTCQQCGAPLHDGRCEYCGTEYK